MEGIINVPAPVRRILDILEKNGHEGYAVGGCVRDHLLGVEPKDWDITTNAKPEEIKKIFDAKDDIHTVDTGIQHGTVTVVIDHIGYEVTTYRIDGEYKDSRHPESVTFTDDITADLARRDFTMNAIAYNPNIGFVDPFFGREDIEKGIIRAVGNAGDRFDEDALRIMRAVRFSAQLGFEIEEETKKAVFEKAHLIKNISTERIREEFTKTLMTDAPDEIQEFKNTGILDIFIPGNTYDGEKYGRVLRLCPKRLPVRLAVIMAHTDCEDINKTLKKMTYDNETSRMTAAIVQYAALPLENGYDMRVLINKMGGDGAKLELYYRYAAAHPDIGVPDAPKWVSLFELYDKIIKNGDCCTIKQLAINGGDLQALGVPKGQKIGEMLNAALDAVMHDPTLNTKEKLIKSLDL
ncbi:MAG: CCA tRNA nucleotidyltransferase [Firmicutes bacterium]|nr:CCA tRNA nucleotidyltransferase [Bacillota bacterium]